MKRTYVNRRDENKITRIECRFESVKEKKLCQYGLGDTQTTVTVTLLCLLNQKRSSTETPCLFNQKKPEEIDG